MIQLHRPHVILCFLCLLMTISCSPESNLPPGDVDHGGLFVPDGFEVLTVIDSVGRARHLTVRENGDIYVKLNSMAGPYGGNVALRDSNGDGRADIIERFGRRDDEKGSYGAGMIIHDGYLYYGSALTVFRAKMIPDQLLPEDPEIVLFDDHEHGTHWHITKPVSFDDQGYMYIPFGTPSNACQDIQATPNGAPGGQGIDPCPELDNHGGIWRFDASQTDLRQSDGVRIATGIRSVVAMDWNPFDKSLYIVMHGRDNLYSLYPDRYTPWQSAMLPAEEFIRIREGGNYGWPYCYYDQMQGKKVLAPEYGGDGSMIGRCADMDAPLMGFPGHWAPNDLLFYEGDQFPARYKGGAFVAFHGSTNRAPYPQAGYFVAFIPFQKGAPTGEWEVFADGFAQVDTIVNTSDAVYRPMGLAEGPDGSLYITESRNGRIWRVMFKGKKNQFGPEELASMEERKDLPHLRTPDEVSDNLQAHIGDSERLYLTFCGTCHQQDGKGAIGRFPPLKGTDWVSGDKEQLIEVTLEGMQGPLEVNGVTYNAVMPPHGFLSDEDLAVILSYIRQEFGDASPITSDEIAKVRTATSTDRD